VARIQILPGPGDEAGRLFRHAPHVSSAAAALSEAVYDKSKLSVRLRELMRMRIAQINQCHV